MSCQINGAEWPTRCLHVATRRTVGRVNFDLIAVLTSNFVSEGLLLYALTLHSAETHALATCHYFKSASGDDNTPLAATMTCPLTSTMSDPLTYAWYVLTT